MWQRCLPIKVKRAATFFKFHRPPLTQCEQLSPPGWAEPADVFQNNVPATIFHEFDVFKRIKIEILWN
jgi:hypothetical protein